MNKTRQAIETVNFRLYFKVIITQNERQYFTYSVYTEQESENTASPEAKDYLKLLSYIYMIELPYMYNQTSTDPTGRKDNVDEALLCKKLKFFASLKSYFLKLSQGYIFRILQHFATKLCNFAKILVLAVLIEFVLLA